VPERSQALSRPPQQHFYGCYGMNRRSPDGRYHWRSRRTSTTIDPLARTSSTSA